MLINHINIVVTLKYIINGAPEYSAKIALFCVRQYTENNERERGGEREREKERMRDRERERGIEKGREVISYKKIEKRAMNDARKLKVGCK